MNTEIKELPHLEPVNDMVIVERLTPKDRTDSGLYLPDSATRNEIVAKVIAVGPGRMLDCGIFNPVSVKPGERIIFSSYGREFTVNGRTLLALKESEIICRIP